MNPGKIELPNAASRLLSERTVQVRQMVKEILDRDFDFSVREGVETDREKFDYCDTPDELRERWRRVLKYQVLHEYLNAVERESSSPKGNPAANGGKEKKTENTQEASRRKIEKEYDTFFTRIIEEKERERYDRYFGALSKAFDPHSEYLPPENKEDFDIHMR